MLSFISTSETDSPRVPEFYVLDMSGVQSDAAIIAGLGGCTTLGLIYSIAWGFHFPSVAETWIWRILAICVAIIPGGLVAVSSLKRHMERVLFLQTAETEEGKAELLLTWLDFVGIGLMLVLMMARIALVFLPVIVL
jgi:hypothetical protein